MISLIEDTCVRKKQWITHEDMMNVTVIAESTPGPIAINCATFVGYKQKGLDQFVECSSKLTCDTASTNWIHSGSGKPILAKKLENRCEICSRYKLSIEQIYCSLYILFK